MKKTLAFLLIAVVFANLFTFGVCAMGYTFDEFDVYVPDYFVEEYFDDSATTKWVSDDESAQMYLTVINNSDSFSVYDMSLEEVESRYVNELSCFVDGHTITSTTTEFVGNDALSAVISGFIYIDDEPVASEAYLFSTENNIYSLEFLFYSDSLYDCVEDVLDSVYLFDTVSVFEEDDDYYDEDDDILDVIVSFVVAGLSALIGFAVKNFSKNKNTSQKSNNSAKEKFKLPDSVTALKKFELNGKAINVFNERFTIGNKDENFAKKELERERKEREKMFK